MRLLLSWAICAFGVWVAVTYVPGLAIEEGYGPLFIVALILGLLNALVRPIIAFLSCGLIFLTLGLFLLVINAGMLILASSAASSFGIDFRVDGFVPALIGSLVISAISFLASMLMGGDDRE
jgi:putative membrane protein